VKLPSRPDLKMPEVKVPAFLSDLYQDLRDRRLLPLVALVLVAILAVPFLLGDDSGGPADTPSVDAVDILRETAPDPSALEVVEAKPGLRDYRRRLKHQRPTDPFKQRYTRSQVNGGAKLNEPKSTSETGTGSGSGKTSTSTTDGGSSPAGNPGKTPAGDGGGNGGKTGSGTTEPPSATLYTFGVDVKVIHSSGSEATGDKRTGDPIVRKKVLPPTSLPGKKKEVVSYIGINPKTRRPLLLVSTQVTGVFGEGKCVSGSEVCQLVEVEPGFPEVFVYGEGGDRYKITVSNVQVVFTGRT
jgi:hypothetical protein